MVLWLVKLEEQVSQQERRPCVPLSVDALKPRKCRASRLPVEKLGRMSKWGGTKQDFLCLR